MLAIKPVYKIQNLRKDGTVKLYLQYCHSSDIHPLLETGIGIPPKYWNRKKLLINADLPEIYGSAETLNEELRMQTRKAEDFVTLLLKKKVTDPVEMIKLHYSSGITLSELEALLDKTADDVFKNDVTKNQDIYFQIDHYINGKLKKVSKDMGRIYRNMKDHLKEFEMFRKEPVTFDCLDINFYEAFVDFLTYDYVHKARKKKIVGLKVNTVGRTIKQFLGFIKDRVKKRIIKPIDMAGWKILEEEVDAIYLTTQEILKIYKLDLSEYPQLAVHRNDFLLGCLTGMRFSDFSKLSPEDMRGHMLHKKQQKSEHWVVIPLMKEAKKILDQRFESNAENSCYNTFNNQIKTIGKLAGINYPVKHSYKKGNKMISEIRPKYAWITTHTCRRSFCTNEFLAGTPVELIMKISGHKSVKDFYKYIRISPEEAAVKIRDIWRERGSYLAG